MALGIFLTGDLHLGMKFSRYPEAQAALVEARFSCLERIVAAANSAGAGGAASDLLVVAGDLFESVNATRRDVQRAARTLAGFHGKLVAVMPGNHDYVAPDDELWPRFREAGADSLLLLDQPRPYPLSPYDLDVCLYPGPCTSKHSERNAVGWIREAAREAASGAGGAAGGGQARHRIGIAHGSLEGFSPDMDGRYYPMRPAELREAGMTLWLLGHTHARFPAAPGAQDRIFCAGTPEPDGFDCAHEGAAWSLTVEDSGAVSARAVKTGGLRFVDESKEVMAAAALEKIERGWTGPEAARTLLRLRLTGRAPREVISSIGEMRKRMSRALLHLDLRADELREEITADAIDREYPAGSFPHSLLTRLAADGDLEGLQIAHDLMREISETRP